MWNNITKIFGSALAMLQYGKTPPNTPEKYKNDLSKINMLASKKFFMIFMSIIFLAIFYISGTVILFLTAPLPSITGPFVTIFTKVIEILAIIISVYLSAQGIIDFKYNSSSNVEQVSENVNVKETLEQKVEYIDDSRGRFDYQNDE